MDVEAVSRDDWCSDENPRIRHKRHFLVRSFLVVFLDFLGYLVSRETGKFKNNNRKIE